MYFKQI
jgi:hypothetical protein